MISFRLRNTLPPSPDRVRRCSWALFHALRPNLTCAHVFSAVGFDLLPQNFEGKFFYQNFEDFIGFRHDLRSDHDIYIQLGDLWTPGLTPPRFDPCAINVL